MTVFGVLRGNLLFALTVLGVVVGISSGIALRYVDLSETARELIGFPGEIFMQVLKMMVLPLMFVSVVSSLSQMDGAAGGRVATMTVAYYIFTATLTSIIGATFVLSIAPGLDRQGTLGANHNASGITITAQANSMDTFMDIIRNMFPENIFKATTTRVKTIRTDEGRDVVDIPGTNILGVLVFSCFLGVVAARQGESGRVFVQLFASLDQIIMRLVKLLLYIATVLMALGTHALIVTPSLFILFTRKNPIPVYKTMLQPFFVAFGTSSSGAAVPTSIRCLDEKYGLDSRIAAFVPPLGSSINMDGAALYEAMAVIFIAQLNGIELSWAAIVTIFLTATLASLGSGTIPAGLVTILIILNTAGLPTDDIPLIFTVDWLIDRIRTAINVMGDGFVAVIVSHYAGRTKTPKEKMPNYIPSPQPDRIPSSASVTRLAIGHDSAV